MRVGRFSVPSPMPFTLSDTVNIWLTQVPSLSLIGEYICQRLAVGLDDDGEAVAVRRGVRIPQVRA